MDDDLTETAADRDALSLQVNGFERAVVLASDVVGMLGVPTGLLQRRALASIEKRRSEHREVLMEQIRAGSVDLEEAIVAQIDEVAAMTLRYMRASEEGTRLRNMKLLAKILVRSTENRTASAEEFQDKAAAIETLSPGELKLLGEWMRFDPHCTFYELLKYLNLGEAAQPLYGVAAGMMREGLLVPGSAWGGIAFDLSPIALKLLDELRAEDFYQE